VLALAMKPEWLDCVCAKDRVVQRSSFSPKQENHPAATRSEIGFFLRFGRDERRVFTLAQLL
jgi:hypothetical protein